MGHEDRRRARALQDLAHLGADRSTERRVQVGERLIEQDHGWSGGEGAGQRHSLRFAARKFVRVAVGELVEVDQAQQLIDTCGLGLVGRAGTCQAVQPEAGAPPAGGARRARAVEAVADVSGHCEVREERVVLENHSHAAALRRDEGARAHHLATGDVDCAAVRALEARDHPEGRGFAAAARGPVGRGSRRERPSAKRPERHRQRRKPCGGHGTPARSGRSQARGSKRSSRVINSASGRAATASRIRAGAAARAKKVTDPSDEAFQISVASV